jgi:hypothetical protein
LQSNWQSQREGKIRAGVPENVRKTQGEWLAMARQALKV